MMGSEIDSRSDLLSVVVNVWIMVWAVVMILPSVAIEGIKGMGVQ